MSTIDPTCTKIKTLFITHRNKPWIFFEESVH